MRIGHLILAHNQPRHLKRLIEGLTADGNDDKVFVHIDSKSDIALFHDSMTHPNVVFIQERVPIQWAAFSMVQATLNLLRAAKKDPVKFDYYVLLSGTDYPLRSPVALQEFLKNSQGTEFLDSGEVTEFTESKPLSRFSTLRIEHEHFRCRWLPFHFVRRITGKINFWGFQRNYCKVFKGMSLHAGDQWWTLSDAAIETVFEFIDKKPKIFRFFKNTVVPDESFFQTILANSPLASKVAPSLTFTEWRPKESHPIPIEERHLEEWERNGPCKIDHQGNLRHFFFARKFSDESQHLIQRIRERLWRSC